MRTSLLRLAAPKAFLTTPIFYVNAAPHIGHLYSMVVADVAHRFTQLSGRPSVLSTGTDEHGTKVERAAQAAGKDPQLFVDTLSAQFKRLADDANIEYTRFVRTTDADHVGAARRMWTTLKSAGLIYLSKHSGWYCVSDETFYPETELVKDTETGALVSAESGNPVEWYEEENWFFRLSQFRDRLVDWYEAHPDFVVPSARHASLLAELRTQELNDLSISRPLERSPWGIPVPDEADGDAKHTMYVWFEALVNYLTVAESIGDCWPPVNVVGKDIVRFHAVYWPAFLMGAGLEPPKHVVVHNHWTIEGAKMSKSKKNVVDPFEAIDTYGLDTIRYALCHNSSLAHDSPFSYDRVVELHNVNLVNKWGNLAARVCGPKFDLPASLAALKQLNAPFDSALLDKCSEYAAKFELGRYAQLINEAGMAANQAVQDAEPWTDPESEHSCLSIARAAETCRVMALLLQPICPTYAAKMLDRLAVVPGRRSLEWAVIGKDLDYGVGANRKGDHILQRIR